MKATERYADYEYLLFDRPADRVLRITINRPEKLNALPPGRRAVTPSVAPEQYTTRRLPIERTSLRRRACSHAHLVADLHIPV